VVVSDGPLGLHASRAGVSCYEPASTYGWPVVDDVGAGDRAQAALVDALLRGEPLQVALRAAARQGIELCTGRGATTRILDCKG
jgi:sugar/nucleoside kinase (ribokinase family)